MQNLSTKEMPGYRVQPWGGVSCRMLSLSVEEVYFSTWEGNPCVEAVVWMGLAKSPYLLHLTIDQALEADIIQRA